MKNTKLVGGAVCAIAMAVANQSYAVTFTGTQAGGSGGARSASAEFTISGGNLVITLSNTATWDAFNPTDILTGVFFNLHNGAPLTPVSAVGGGSVVTYAGGGSVLHPSGWNVGGEYGYATGISIDPPNTGSGANAGVSSSGLGLFAGGDFPNFLNQAGPVALDGVQFGVTTVGDNLATGNGGLTGVNGGVFVEGSVVLTLSGIPADFNLDGITDVVFQYGTDLTEPHFGGGCTDCGGNTPDSGNSVILLGVSLLGLAGLSLRYRRQRRVA